MSAINSSRDFSSIPGLIVSGIMLVLTPFFYKSRDLLPIFKVRIRNSDVSRGKSGGYRVIYYLKTATAVILVTIYSKTEQSDISSAKIKKILSEFK